MRYITHIQAMENTLFLDGFQRLCGRGKKPTAKIFEERLQDIKNSLPGHLFGLLEPYVNIAALQLEPHQRNRIFTPAVTLWAMLSQALRGGSLRDALSEVSSGFSLRGETAPSVSTGSYSDARQRLRLQTIEKVDRAVKDRLWTTTALVPGTRVLGVDATSVQLPDTPINQDHFPQPSNQAPGCGFPVMQLVALVDLDTGVLEQVTHSPLNVNEGGLFETELLPTMRAKDLLVGDRAYGSYLHAACMQARGVDWLTRLNNARQWPKNARGNDVTVEWKRPARKDMPPHVSDEQWAALPQTLTVRYVRYKVESPGSRTREVIVVTSRFDLRIEDITRIYHARWDVELSFKDLKTTMGMEFVNTQSPAMAWKVVRVYLLAYNLLRALMLEASRLPGAAPLKRLSFKGTLDRLLSTGASLSRASASMARRLRSDMLAGIALDAVPDRPDRLEPRVVKRRQKHYSKMTRPRHQKATT